MTAENPSRLIKETLDTEPCLKGSHSKQNLNDTGSTVDQERNSMNIFWKIISSSVVGIVILGALSLGLTIRALEQQGRDELEAIQTTLIEGKTVKTRNLVEAAHKIAERMAAREGLSETEQKQAAIEAIRAMRYNSTNYIWINDSKAIMILHPGSPESEGKSFYDHQDPTGKKFFHDFIQISRDKGEGVVRYSWPRPGEQTATEKLSYVKYFKPWDWVIGTGEYIDDIKKEVEAKRQQINASVSRLMYQSILIITLVLAFSLIAMYFMSKFITRPIDKTSAILKEIAEGQGDLTKRLSIGSKDEVGQMASWFDMFIAKLHDIVRNISEYFETVTASANQLLVVSKQMDDGVHSLSQKSESVALEASEMSQNMGSVTAASEEAVDSVKQVMGTVDMMRSMVAEIGRNSEQARSITNRAVQETRQASSKIDSLGQAAAKINTVTEVITEISDQTNLLALNATIEAARAGEAGKGFAVVANEIKELARQTAEATRNIRHEIEGVQDHIGETVQDISRIADVITEVDSTVSNITASVEAQTGATAEIVHHLEQTSAGIEAVCGSIAQSSESSQKIAAEIADVNGIAKNLSRNSSKVSMSASDLTQLASDLKKMIGEFKVERSSQPTGVLTDDTSELISWDESLHFGITTIDQQHRRLVDLVNKLYRAMRNRAGKTALGGILTELAQYTVDHFRDEEALMVKAGYEQLNAHKKEHEKLVGSVVDFQKKFQEGSATVSLDLMNFLSNWLLNHIKIVDRRYVSALKKIGQ